MSRQIYDTHVYSYIFVTLLPCLIPHLEQIFQFWRCSSWTYRGIILADHLQYVLFSYFVQLLHLIHVLPQIWTAMLTLLPSGMFHWSLVCPFWRRSARAPLNCRSPRRIFPSNWFQYHGRIPAEMERCTQALRIQGRRLDILVGQFKFLIRIYS
jgi:hypothetical protein